MLAKNVPNNIEVVIRGKRSELEKLGELGLVFDTQSERFKICLIGGKWILFEVEDAKNA